MYKYKSGDVKHLRFCIPSVICLFVVINAFRLLPYGHYLLAAGMARLCSTCGAVTGAYMVISLKHGNNIIPGLPDEVWPLIFNTGESLMQADAQWAFGCLDYDLTYEQLTAILPNLNMTLAANAFYGADGALLSVTALETLIHGRMDYPALYDEAYKRTEIQLGDGKIIEDCIVIYECTPQISDVSRVPVTAYMLDFNNKDAAAFFQAEFMLDNIAYRVKLHDNVTDGQKRLTEIVNAIISNGAADLSVLADPAIPEMRHGSFTLNEARLDPDFGSFIPAVIPNEFVFESSYRVIDHRQNNLSVHWGKPNSYIEILVSEPTEYDRGLIVSVSEQEKYDMSLCTIPLVDS